MIYLIILLIIKLYFWFKKTLKWYFLAWMILKWDKVVKFHLKSFCSSNFNHFELKKLNWNTTQIKWIKQLSLLQFNRAKRAKFPGQIWTLYLFFTCFILAKWPSMYTIMIKHRLLIYTSMKHSLLLCFTLTPCLMLVGSGGIHLGINYSVLNETKRYE